MKPLIKQLLKEKYNFLHCWVSDVIFKIWVLQKKNNKVAKTLKSGVRKMLVPNSCMLA